MWTWLVETAARARALPALDADGEGEEGEEEEGDDARGGARAGHPGAKEDRATASARPRARK